MHTFNRTKTAYGHYRFDYCMETVMTDYWMQGFQQRHADDQIRLEVLQLRPCELCTPPVGAVMKPHHHSRDASTSCT